jgi:hypothetical protein
MHEGALNDDAFVDYILIKAKNLQGNHRGCHCDDLLKPPPL